MKSLYHLLAIFVSVTITFTSSADAQKPDTSDSLSIYAVPGKNKLQIKIIAAGDVKTQFQVVDVSGRMQRSKSVALKQGINTVNINIGSLTAGIYFLKILQPGIIKTVKFIIGTSDQQMREAETLGYY